MSICNALACGYRSDDYMLSTTNLFFKPESGWRLNNAMKAYLQIDISHFNQVLIPLS